MFSTTYFGDPTVALLQHHGSLHDSTCYIFFVVNGDKKKPSCWRTGERYTITCDAEKKEPDRSSGGLLKEVFSFFPLMSSFNTCGDDATRRVTWLLALSYTTVLYYALLQTPVSSTLMRILIVMQRNVHLQYAFTL